MCESFGYDSDDGDNELARGYDVDELGHCPADGGIDKGLTLVGFIDGLELDIGEVDGDRVRLGVGDG